MEELDLLGTGETPICLADAAKLLPTKADGKPISIKTLERWIRVGYRKLIFLEGTKIGGTLYTSASALKRFTDKCLADDRKRFFIPQAAVTAAEVKPAAKPANSKARRELAAAGWGTDPAKQTKKAPPAAKAS